MENFNMFVLHMIMCRRRWQSKRQNMWVHPIRIKRPEFGIFSHLYWGLLEDEQKFHGFFRMNFEQFYSLSQLVAEEIRKQNTNYRRTITPEE
jgi:prolipoprotein diacylglyceryltransferase